jgi:hypothetical protein
LVLGFALRPGSSAAAEAPRELPEYTLKAEFVERFTRFVEWPETALGDPNVPFVIGVWGQSPFESYLDQLAASRRIKGHPVWVLSVGRIEDLDHCQLVFISGSTRGALLRVLGRTAGRPILTVADTSGFGEAGVIINFFKDEDRLRFEVNEAAAERTGLRLGAQLLQLARMVRAQAQP